MQKKEQAANICLVKGYFSGEQTVIVLAIQGKG
jgi:hypothetical protein